MLKAFAVCLKSDLYVLARNRAQWFYALVFFAIFVFLFSVGLGDLKALQQFSPAIIWIGFLLTSLLTVESVFHQDKKEGGWEQLILSPYPLWWLMLAKALAFWLVSFLPLILIAPLLGQFMQLPWAKTQLLVLSLLLGSPALTLMGVVGGALTIALPRAGLFLGLLLLPLYVPILILGEGALADTVPHFQMALLAAMSVFALTLAPHAAAAALKAAMD